MPDTQGSPPRVMLVTDRRRLTAALGIPDADWEGVLTEQIRGALAGGVDVVQVREPDLAAAQLSHFLRTLFQNVADCRARIVVNDRVDVALAVGAGGVHLPERGLPVASVRRLLGDRPMRAGRSVHGIREAARSREADYLIAGSIGASRSHPGGAVLGWEGFRDAAAAAGRTPVFGIGGLGAGDVEQILQSGGSGLAAIGWFVPPSGHRDLAGFVQQRASELRLVFDSRADVSYTRWAGR